MQSQTALNDIGGSTIQRQMVHDFDTKTYNMIDYTDGNYSFNSTMFLHNQMHRDFYQPLLRHLIDHKLQHGPV